MKLFALENGWTGGQFSFFRLLFGIYLCIHFTNLISWGPEIFSSAGMLADGRLSSLIYLFPNIFLLNDSPLFVQTVISVGAISALLIAAGYKTRSAALIIFYILACLYGRNPLIANPALPYVGFMLLSLLFVPPAPFGSREARGRLDLGRNWVMPKDVFLAAWIVLALSYSYSGYTKMLSPSWLAGENINLVLNNPLARDYFLRDFMLWLPPIFLNLLTWAVLYIELLFAPLVLFARLRPILWGLMFLIQFGFAFLLNFIDLTAAMLLFHLFTLDPAWIRGRKVSPSLMLFYDGHCGFCHAVIRFLLAEDDNQLIRFSPLQGDHLKTRLEADKVAALPDSIVLLTAGGDIYLKSTAVGMLLVSLGGLWRPLGELLLLIPASLRDFGYTAIGKVRKKLAPTPSDLCPLLTPDLRARFEN
jgi:predicted DCC family thiol-disulfide oxidoreductase YuxK